MKIKNKILLGFLTITFTTTFFCFFVIRNIAKNEVIELIGNYNNLLSEAGGNSIDRVIFSRLERWEAYINSNNDLWEALHFSNGEFDQMEDRDVYVKNQDELWKTSSPDQISDFMKSIIDNSISIGLRDRLKFYSDKYGYNIFPEIFVTNKYGVNIAQNKKTSDYYQADEEWWQKAKDEGIYVSDIVYDDSSYVQSLELCIRIDDPKKNFLGVVKVIYDIKDIFNIIDEIAGNSTNNIIAVNSDFSRKTINAFLLTGDGKLIYSTRDGFGNFVDKGIYLNKFENKGMGDLPYLIIQEDGLEKLFSHKHLQGYGDYKGLNWVLFISKDTKEVLQPLNKIIDGIAIVSGISFIIAIFIALFLSGYLTKSIKKLLHDTEIIEKGDLNHKAGTGSKDEIGQLSRSFDKMIVSIKKSHSEVNLKVEEQTKVITQKTKDLEDQQKAIINVLEDVEEEKKQVSIEKTRYESLLASIGDGIIATDNQTRIIVLNQAASDILGYTLKEVLGRKLADVIEVVDEHGKPLPVGKRPITIAVKTLKPFRTSINNNYYYLTKDKRKIPVALSTSPVQVDKKLFGVINIFRDITHEKDVDRMKTEFISLSSHQLRTPLSAIKWFTEMLLAGDAGKLTKDQLDFITNISESTERMIVLVNSLLNISRIESGRIIIDPKPTCLGDLVNQVLAEIKNNIEEKKQTVIVSVHPDLPKINIDPKLITEVYKNLLTNANKYTPDNGEISVMISVKDNYVLSQVSDNGLGIPKANQSKLFDKFYRADNVVKLDTEGTGLGLYLAKSIVESSGGKIWFESEEGKGSCFWFTLPLTGSQVTKGEVTINS